MRQASTCMAGMVMVGCLGVSMMSVQAEDAAPIEVEDAQALAASVGQRVTVTGVAAHAKAGSAIVLLGSVPIYLDGMLAWSDKELDKTVTATGRLETEVGSEDPKSQTWQGTRYLLKAWTYSMAGVQEAPPPAAGGPTTKH